MDKMKDNRLSPNKKIRNDILFIAILLLVVAIAGGCLWLFRGEGDTVTVLGGSGAVSFAAAAARVGTIAYELMTALSPRAEIFYSNGE